MSLIMHQFRSWGENLLQYLVCSWKIITAWSSVDVFIFLTSVLWVMHHEVLVFYYMGWFSWNMITTLLNHCHSLVRWHWCGQLIAAEIELVVCFDIWMVYPPSILPLRAQTLEGQEECTLSTKPIEVVKSNGSVCWCLEKSCSPTMCL